MFEGADTYLMTTQVSHVQVRIENAGRPLSGAEAAQVIRDIYLGNLDPEAYQVRVLAGIGTHG